MSLGVRGADTAYIFMHGAHYNDHQYLLSSALVARNGDETTEDTQGVDIISPSDPYLRFHSTEKFDPNENWNLLAEQLTLQNPRWLISAACNAMGVTPSFYEQLIRLPQHERKLEYVVLPRPGRKGLAIELNEPILAESLSEMDQQDDAGLRLYRKTSRGWEDRGIFISNRLHSYGLDHRRLDGGLSTAAYNAGVNMSKIGENDWFQYKDRMYPVCEINKKQLEQYEIRQLGETEYLFRAAQALCSRDMQSIKQTFSNRPALTWALYQFQKTGKIPGNWHVDNPEASGRLKFEVYHPCLVEFSNRLEKEAVRISHGKSSISFLDRAGEEALPYYFSPCRYAYKSEAPVIFHEDLTIYAWPPERQITIQPPVITSQPPHRRVCMSDIANLSSTKFSRLASSTRARFHK